MRTRKQVLPAETEGGDEDVATEDAEDAGQTVHTV